MIQNNVRSGKPPLCETGNFDVYAQMDVESPEKCYFPQVEVLDEIHKAHPDSTFIFNSRNITSWVKSIRGWYDMVDRLTKCNITGFPTGVGKTDEELMGFYNSQRQRVRDFVALHPSHRLVEVQIDSPDAGMVMQKAFGIDQKCWGRTNVGSEIVPAHSDKTVVIQNDQPSKKGVSATSTVSVPNKSQKEDGPHPVDKSLSKRDIWPNPVIVVGLPKTGTTSVARYFKCGGGRRVSHWLCKDNELCGPIIRNNVRSGKPPLFETGNFDVYAQMDVEDPPCYFPQVEALDEIHKAHPNSTFIFNSRNISSWVKSVRGWNNMGNRLTQCNITGFPAGVGKTDAELMGFYYSQLQRVRDFVALHPSHRLVEVQIDSPDAGMVMKNAFGIDKKCWGRTNLLSEKLRKEEKLRKKKRINHSRGQDVEHSA